jgi:hypothetical protein
MTPSGILLDTGNSSVVSSPLRCEGLIDLEEDDDGKREVVLLTDTSGDRDETGCQQLRKCN